MSNLSVSVCVPSYERPREIEQLIQSVRRQESVLAELCISDDSTTDSVQEAIERTGNGLTIRYHRNSPSLGFAANLRNVLRMASGDVIVILGDDDTFAVADALAAYRDTFTHYTSAYFACSSLLQTDDDLRVTLAYPRCSAPERLVRAGEQALASAWMSSIVITGLAFRHGEYLERYYPDDSISPGVERLYPQVGLTGRILMEWDAVLIGRYLCAFRAHKGQLGFAAAKGPVDGHDSAHGLIELPAIANELARAYPAAGFSIRTICARELSRQYRTNMLNECIEVGVSRTRRRVLDYVLRNRDAPGRIPLLLSVSFATFVPVPVLRLLKAIGRKCLAVARLHKTDIPRDFVRVFLDVADDVLQLPRAAEPRDDALPD